jgi:hypothetical protein
MAYAQNDMAYAQNDMAYAQNDMAYAQNDMQKPSYCHPDEPWRRRISLFLNPEPLYAKGSPYQAQPNISDDLTIPLLTAGIF